MEKLNSSRDVSSGSVTRPEFVQLLTEEFYDVNAEDEVQDRAERIDGYCHEAKRNSVVGIIGAGGIGGEIAEAEIRKGTGTLYFFDPDHVEISNLHRQKFFPEDIGKNKAVCLSRNLAKQACYESRLLAFPGTFEEAAESGIDVSDWTAAVVGVDQDSTRAFCSQYFRSRNNPCIFVAVSWDAAYAYTFLQEAGPEKSCWLCLYPRALEKKKRNPCPVGSTIDVLKAVAGYVSYALDSLVMPRRLLWNYKRICLTGDYADVTKTIERNPECPVCSKLDDQGDWPS